MDRQDANLHSETNGSGTTAHSSVNAPSNSPSRSQAKQPSHSLQIAIAATFTADSIVQPLRFWMERLTIELDIRMAPHGQIMQVLLDPESLFARNTSGVNALLVRMEDWIRDRMKVESVENNLEHIRSATRELLAALVAFHTRSSAPMLVILCPSSSALPSVYREPLEQARREVSARLATIPRVHSCDSGELARLYPVAEIDDEGADRIGHIPYTREYFIAMATLLARRAAALVKPPYKVIAFDADNTLWRGICGEDGPTGVELTPAHLRLQRILVQQHDAGVLLCLCSKNNPADVEAVFKARPDMPLREEHLAGSRVSWDAKSSSLRSLSAELGLSLDSFIFIDDSALECAEVQAHCPTALVLRLPESFDEMERFLGHTWAFDHFGVTEDARRRTAQYRDNRARSAALEDAGGLERFLASLELSVDVLPMQADQLPRVAELLQRTNQFNLTTVRRRSSEIDALRQSRDLDVLVAHVRDRFGDYGLVGALFLRRTAGVLDVDTFVLSCRALGRGVEHRLVSELGRIASAEGRETVLLRYRPTARNAPAREFLERSFMQFRAPSDGGIESSAESVFAVPAAYAGQLRGGAGSASAPAPATTSETNTGTERPTSSTAWHEEAYRLSRIADIAQEIRRSRRPTPARSAEYVAARTATQMAVADIWADVLGIDRVGVHDNFFDLGGDSLLAVSVVSRIESALGREVALHEFFDASTVEQLAERVERAAHSHASIDRVDRSRPLPLSSTQRRLWFIHQLEGGSLAYHIPFAVRLSGPLDRGALQAAFDTLIERHEALRTVFVEFDGEPVQKILPAERFALEIDDLSVLPAERHDAEVRRRAREQLAQPLNLGTGPLMRGLVLRLSKEEHVLLLTMHHMVSDGWSMGVLMQELHELYGAYLAGRANPLPPLPLQYADYAHWQRKMWAAERHESLDFWAQHLRGAPELLELPTDRPRPAVRSYRGGSVPVSLGRDTTDALKALAREHNLTLAMALYAAWTIVLSRLSGQDDIVVGMPVANRPRTQLEGLIGFFANTVAVRARLEDDPCVTDLLRRIKTNLLAAYAHQDVPFEQVVETLAPARSLSHTPIFQAMFVLQDAAREPMRLPGLTLEVQDMPLETAQFDVLLSLQESATGISGSLNYASDLFDGKTAERWAGYLETVLGVIANPSELRISALPLMSESERQRLLVTFNPTQETHSSRQQIHQIFESQAAKTPHATAVLHGCERLTYAQLNAKANQLAHYLREQGVAADKLVAICVERSLEMVVGLLAILKAGGAYVPLDPAYPSERLAYMLEDSAPLLVLTQASLVASLPATKARIVALDEAGTQIATQPSTNLAGVASRSGQLAYVIYTSGSTGKPKGVMVEHGNVTRLFAATDKWFSFNEHDVWTLFHSFAFDFSVWELWGALLYGGRLVIVPYLTTRAPQEFYRLLCDEGVTVLNQTPSAFAQLIEAQARGDSTRRHSLRVVIFGGEALELRMLRPWVKRNGAEKPQLVNMYGITETTVHVSYRPLSANEIASERGSVVGKTIPDLRAYVLDRHRQPVPTGVAGEIYVAGAGVARGYLNRPELTAERFVHDPFGNDARAKMYKTGDLARWRADGELEYLGRNDHQVKIRGFRIELGEIEARLALHEAVKEAVVLAREDVPGEKRLVAYLVPSGKETPSIETLRAHLKSALPDHMVPSAFVMLEQLPLTPNGKLDRKALPRPDLDAYARQQYEAPQGEIEEILAGIWQGLLRLERVGRHDNFFELGGHSLLIVQMLERLRRLGLTTDVRRVFESQTLADLANALTRGAVDPLDVPPNRIPVGAQTITPQMLPLVELEPEHLERIVHSVPGGAANIQDIYPLAPLQEGILFHYLLDEQRGDAYVRPMLLSLASRERLDELITALQAVIDRHDVLRTAVRWEQLPQPVQVVHRHATLPVKEITLLPDRDPIEQLTERMKPQQQRLDLRQAPLMQLEVAADPHGTQWFALLRTHHLICDNESLEILLAEVASALEGHVQQLPEPVPYRNHVAQALAHARDHDAENFFRKKLADVDEPTAPFGILDVHGDSSQIERARQALDPELARQLRIQARRLNVSAAALFHAAWGLVVARTTGREDVVFGTVLLGRLQGSAGAQRILGMFINTLPLRLPLQDVSAKELVERTQREVVELLSHEQSSLAVAQRCSGVAASAPLFTTLLNYRHSASELGAELAGAAGVRLIASEGSTNYPIVLSVDDQADGFALELEADRRIDLQRLLGYAATTLGSLVEALEQAPETPALALPILPQSERQHIVERFNATQAFYPEHQLIHELFEEQVARTPRAIALLYERQSLTFAELDAKANQLARYLRNRGIGPDQRVGICLDRSLEMVIGLLGILKAGGAYVPMDPGYPAERLAYMLGDAAPKVLLIQERLRTLLPQSDAELIALDTDWSTIAQYSSDALQASTLGLRPHHLAYVIYTSGSTGWPKGVMIEHRQVVNLAKGLERAYGDATQCARIALNASINFDASVQQWVQLASGHTLVVIPEECRRDVTRMLRLLDESQVDGVDCTPSQLKGWLSSGLLASNRHPLRTVLVGGEPIDPELWTTLATCAETAFYNVYGPTECTVDATLASLSRDTSAPHIGKPMDNRRVYILDGRGEPAPISVAGEIYIAGVGVGRGYLNRPELTAERFVRDPFSTDPQARMYKTGDLGRWRSDGAIEYLGRNDHQVKIRGFRIELGEIEARLALHEEVKEAVVLAREDVPGEKRLVAYLVLSGKEAPSIETLRAHLKSALPDHMVPSAFVMLEQLPLTPNGKLDRKALPRPDLDAYARQQYEAPQGEIEEILAGIWQGLLRLKRVGRHDNFFELGGHSLLIVQMLERLRRLGLTTDVRRVFESPSLADLASALTSESAEPFDAPPNRIPLGAQTITPQMLPLVDLEPEHLERIVHSVPGGAANIQDIYPLAPLQEGILFHYLLDEQHGDAYVRPMLLSLASRERLDELTTALQAVIDRHDVLRTAVRWEQLPQPVQVVHRHATLPVEEIALLADQDPIEQLTERMKPQQQRLNLRQAPLMQLEVAADPRGTQWYALLRTHHLICDNESLEILLAEVASALEGHVQQLPEPVPYRNHVAQALAHARGHDAENFFRKKLADVDEPTAPFGILDVHGDSSQIERARQALDPELAGQLRIQARRLNVSAAALFHAAWGLVVARTTGREDVVFGTVLLGRLQGSAGAQRILGMFINTLPLRLRLQDVSAKELVERTQREVVELLSHEQSSLAVAQRCSGVAASAPLFTTLLNYRHSEADTGSALDRAAGVTLLASQGGTNYPILLSVDEQSEGFALELETQRRINPQQMLSYAATAIRSLVEALEQAPGTPALALSVLPQSERQLIVERFNATAAAYPEHKLVHELFEEQVTRTPEAIALLYEGQSLTYAELNAKANQLARYLRGRGIGPDQQVGVCLDRSLEMVIGLLGILKAGGAYVPMDPGYPAERLVYMLGDAAPKVLLIQARLRTLLPQSDAEFISLDTEWHKIGELARANLDARELGLRPHHLAYVIYTSGSTGKPKGAMNEHRGVVNRIQWMQDAYRLGTDDRVLQKTPFSFDVSVWEFFWTLMSGARLVVARPDGHKDPSYLRELIEETSVTTLHFVPSMLQSFLDNHDRGRCASLRHVVCSGEELSATLQRKCFDCLPRAQLSNLYGPTEAAVDVTAWECRPDDDSTRVPIGRPIANIQMYVLDRHNEPVPIGVAGEIYIAGVGVGRGYLNRPELTAERFVRDPFSTDPQARMYKTGDLGRWRSDGAIEYLGRNDHQVKIRGFRIELGEIEARLALHEAVKEAVVLAREDVAGEKRLVAYLVPSGKEAPSIETLRAHLKSALPDHMVPSAFVILEQLPLTPNGKLDRKALPRPDLDAYARQQYEAPQGEIEEILAGIWQGLLRLERVGRHDNFFELGGHSLLIVQMLERLRRLGLTTDVRRVFESPSLADLASALTSESAEPFDVPPNRIPLGAQTITPQMLPLVDLEPEHLERIVHSVPGGAANIQDIYPLTPLQEGILFHELMEAAHGSTYVLPALLSVSTRERLDDLVNALQGVIDRHEVLRTAVLSEKLPRPVQVVYRKARLPVDVVSLDDEGNPLEQVRAWMAPELQRLSLREAPLIRLQVAADPHGPQWFVLLQLHHIVCDHVTMELIISEAVAHLRGDVERPAPSAPFRNHVAQTLAQSSKHDAQRFFSAKLGDIDEPTAPFGLVEAHVDASQVEQASEPLDAMLAERVRTQARRMSVSVATLFHAAWAIVVARTSGRDDVVFGDVLLGRMHAGAEMQRAPGLFINTLPMRLRIGELTAKQLIELTQRELLELLSHEQASLADAQRCSGIVGSAPLFTVLFNYRHSAPGAGADWNQAEGVRLLALLERTNYPLAMSVDDLGDGFVLTAQADLRIDARRMTGYLHRAVRCLVEALETAPQTPALALPILPESELRAVTEGFNATQATYPREKLIHELFETQVERLPEAVAIVEEDRSLNYVELNRKANQLAWYLKERGVEVGEHVPILMARSLEMVMAELAVLKVGAVYVPMDPEMPAERQAFMIRDCGARHILVDAPNESTAALDCIDCSGVARGISNQPTSNPSARIDSLAPAYVMYTSGSTGTPKGVVVPHRAVNRLVINNGYATIGPEDCLPHHSNPAFDASTFEIWGALLSGARIVVVPQQVLLDARRFTDTLERHRVTMLWMSVGLFSQYADSLADVLPQLRYLIVGGDRVDPEVVRRVLRRGRPQHFLNAYGPTECTTFSTTHPIESLDDGVTSIPIGRPIANAQIYILDAHRQAVPIGVVGEMYIGGDGVALGYLSRPELTAERFVPDPYSADISARLYKTGDLARWRADGAIEFMGRNDHQVKIRGFRIELGEIEAQLARHPQVTEAAVVVREEVSGDKRLVAYVVTSGALEAEELRRHLKLALPEYMVPSAVVTLEHLPLNANGKLDRKALPAPELEAYASQRYVAPEGEVEEALAAIWQELLGVERVGRDDNFFELGGHSLHGIALIAKVSERLAVDLSVIAVFQYPKLSQLAGAVDVLQRQRLLDTDLAELQEFVI